MHELRKCPFTLSHLSSFYYFYQWLNSPRLFNYLFDLSAICPLHSSQIIIFLFLPSAKRNELLSYITVCYLKIFNFKRTVNIFVMFAYCYDQSFYIFKLIGFCTRQYRLPIWIQQNQICSNPANPDNKFLENKSHSTLEYDTNNHTHCQFCIKLIEFVANKYNEKKNFLAKHSKYISKFFLITFANPFKAFPNFGNVLELNLFQDKWKWMCILFLP